MHTITNIEYLEQQANNLSQDYKTKSSYITDDQVYYKYDPQHFDLLSLISDYDIDENNFSLTKARHIIALMIGFKSWVELLRASESEIELGRLLFDNQHKISVEEWEMYIEGAEEDNNATFDDDFRLEVFKQVFLNVDAHESLRPDYRLKKSD